jgi:hypothetical protein
MVMAEVVVLSMASSADDDAFIFFFFLIPHQHIPDPNLRSFVDTVRDIEGA